MRSILRGVLVVLAAVLALSAVAAATASASPQWYTCTKAGGSGVKYASEKGCEKEEHPGTGEWEWAPFTGEGEKTIVVESHGMIWKMEAFELDCTGMKATIAVYNEKHVGAGEAYQIVFNGCTIERPTGCAYISTPDRNENGVLEFASDVPVNLTEREGLTYLEFKQNADGEFANLIIEKSKEAGPCGAIAKEGKLTGSFLAKVDNLTKELELEGESGEKPLKSRSLGVTIQGNAAQNPEKGSIVRAESGSSPPPLAEWGVKENRWEVKEGGSWKTLEAGASRKTIVKQEGTQTITGLGLEITCESMEGRGSIKGEGEGEEGERTYTGCKAVKPSNCAYVSSPAQPNGTIRLEPDLPTQLVSKEGVEYNEIKANATSEDIANVRLEKSEGEGKACGLLPKESRVTGSLLGAVDSAGQTLEFTGLSGASQLKLFGLNGKYKGNEKLEVESS